MSAKITIGVPVYSGMHPKMVEGIVGFDLSAQIKGLEISLDFVQGCLITFARNQIIKRAIDKDKDWLLFWDSDIEIKDDKFFEKMVDAAARHDAAVVGLPCRLKTEEVCYNFADTKDGQYVNYKEVPKEPKEIEVIGTGVMLININWIRKHWKSGPHFWIEDTQAGFFPEDWNFCELVRQKGGKVMVVPSEVVHWGQKGF